ncbi:MAG: DDE-type integrase/transposase/recombinase [Nanoarchaeota archaeon]
MKLTRSKLIGTLKKLNEGVTVYQARKIADISVRRVYQVKEAFDTTGKIPEIGKKVGRPRRELKEWEIDLIKKTFEKYRVSADTLEKIIERDYSKHIGHNRVHKILLQLGFAKPKLKKDIRKKDWIRYERKHSLTAVHIDWHYNGNIWVFAVIDDASRKALAVVECNSPTTDMTIYEMNLTLKQGKIKQCISDHGSQFISNVDGDSRFKTFLKMNGIQQILCRIKHPQSNGKVKKFFDCYDRNRRAFKNLKDFIHWYNEVRLHRALQFEIL